MSRRPSGRRGGRPEESEKILRFLEKVLMVRNNEMSKLLIPDTCQVPNVLLDEVMPRIGGVALKVLLAIVGRDLWLRRAIPTIRIEEKLARLTGLSVQGVLNGTKELGGLIAVTRAPINSRGLKRICSKYRRFDRPTTQRN